MNKLVATTVILLITAGTAMAQKGGKVPWRTDPQAAMADAKKKGLGMMLYFTSEG